MPKSPKKLFENKEEKSNINDIELFEAQTYLKNYVTYLKKKTNYKNDFIKNNTYEKSKIKASTFNRNNSMKIKNSININEERRSSHKINKKKINHHFFNDNANKIWNNQKRKNNNNYLKFRSLTFQKFMGKDFKYNFLRKKNKTKTAKLVDNSIEKKILVKKLENKKYSKKNDEFFIKEAEIFKGENDSKANVFDNENNNNFIKLNDKNIIKINEIKNELKLAIGKNYENQINTTKSFTEEENILNDKKEKIIIDENFKEQFRILTRKGYVYDSYDDEENLDEIDYNFIHPDSLFIRIIDFFVFIFTFYNLFYIPLFLGKRNIYCVVYNKFYFSYFFNNFIDIIFIFDFIISFFVAYLNFDEVLIFDFKLIVSHYLKTWFYIDLISAIPFQTIFTIFNNKCKDQGYLVHPLYGKNFYYLFILLRLLKIFKIISHNKYLEKLSDELSKYQFYNKYGNLIISLFTFFISLHIVACIFIFIGKNDYPNWIDHFNYNYKDFHELYLISIYFMIETLTTVGYGDISFISIREKIFGLFMEVIGICFYSWALTQISNYIKVLNEKTEELLNKINILEDIRNTYPNLPNDLYERILRYLNYNHLYIKKDKHIIIDELPIGLKNSLIYEMYKPFIKNFTFFKNFSNIDFIVKVISAFKPVLSVKNDILIKDGCFVEDMIFVKKGKLSLELPLLFEKPKKVKTIKRNSKFNDHSTFFSNNLSKDLSINLKKTNNLTNIKTNFSFLNSNKSNKDKEKEEKENFQYFKILEIRKNEHFGDILMFLNQKSILRLRVKTKTAELFFLNKEDAINISTTYPQYWKKSNKRSLFNLEQIIRLINKIIKIISTEHGLNPVFKKVTFNEQLKNINKIKDDDLKSIPTFSQESNIYYSNINEQINNEIEEEDENNQNNLLENKKENLKRTSLNTILEDENNLQPLSNKNSSSSGMSLKQNKQKNSNTNISMNKDIESIKNKIYNKYSTPYESDEINNEIYPDENFIISPQNQNFKFKTNYNQNTNFDNISICSTEISFSINSEYENIDELSEHNYSKDVSFRKSINNYIKEEVKKKKNKFKINIINENDDNIYNTNITNKKSIMSRTCSIKSKLRNSLKSPRKSNNFERNNNDLSNRGLLDVGNDKKNNNRNNDDILSVISQNIEKDNMNLNNPELFYSGIFMKFMDKKMITNNEKNNNNEMNNTENEFIRKISSFHSNQFDN